MVSEAGYTLALEDADREATSADPLRFRVLGPDGAALTSYTTAHGKDLHLIVVRRDMAHYQHVHPRLDADGVWTADDLDLSAAGEYRVFADFVPGGAEDGPTLGADLSVAGRYDPRPLPGAATTARVGEYEVELEGELRPGQESELTLTVTRDGRPVTDLQPYLEAYGHLVALRDGDQAYLHVHPTGAPGDGVTDPGPEISFAVTVPSAGAYRLFLDFRHQGVVRTAEFTAVTPGGSASDTPEGTGHGSDSAPTESNQDEPGEGEGDHGH
jgi:hypothetical protein